MRRDVRPPSPIETARGALEPAIHVAEQNSAGIRCDFPEVAWPSGARTQRSGTNQSLLSVGGHDRLAGWAAWRWIAVPVSMLAQYLRPATRIRARPVRSGFGEHLNPIAPEVDGHQGETDRAAKTMHTRVPIATASSGWHGQPHLIRHAHSVHRLQQEIEVQAQLHFQDRPPQLPPTCTATTSQPFISPSRRTLLLQGSASRPDTARFRTCRATCNAPPRRSNTAIGGGGHKQARYI
jgi:hypothetical protein